MPSLHLALFAPLDIEINHDSIDMTQLVNLTKPSCKLTPNLLYSRRNNIITTVTIILIRLINNTYSYIKWNLIIQ